MNSIRAAVIVALAVTGVTCNDLQVGSNHGRIVFNETIQASPAIWRQSQQITINVTDQEIISGVVVTDQRAEKDGEARIIEGGEGQQNVTVELKSPTVFRGFDFHVTAYAAQGYDLRPLLNDAQHPAVIAKDTDLNVSDILENKDSVNLTPKVMENSAGTTLPAEDLPRKYRNTEHPDPIVKFVTEKTDVNQQATELTTDGALKVNGPIVPAILLKGDLPSDNKAQTNGPAVPTPVLVKDFDFKITSTGLPTTTDVPSTTGVPDTTTTEKTHEKMVEQNFDSISRELGQKVVFGIKKH